MPEIKLTSLTSPSNSVPQLELEGTVTKTLRELGLLTLDLGVVFTFSGGGNMTQETTTAQESCSSLLISHVGAL